MASNYRAFNSSFGDDWNTLQRLRNTLGPSWLVRYRLPADFVPPLKRRSVHTGKPVRTSYDSDSDIDSDYSIWNRPHA